MRESIQVGRKGGDDDWWYDDDGVDDTPRRIPTSHQKGKTSSTRESIAVLPKNTIQTTMAILAQSTSATSNNDAAANNNNASTNNNTTTNDASNNNANTNNNATQVVQEKIVPAQTRTSTHHSSTTAAAIVIPTDDAHDDDEDGFKNPDEDKLARMKVIFQGVVNYVQFKEFFERCIKEIYMNEKQPGQATYDLIALSMDPDCPRPGLLQIAFGFANNLEQSLPYISFYNNSTWERLPLLHYLINQRQVKSVEAFMKTPLKSYAFNRDRFGLHPFFYAIRDALGSTNDKDRHPIITIFLLLVATAQELFEDTYLQDVAQAFVDVVLQAQNATGYVKNFFDYFKALLYEDLLGPLLTQIALVVDTEQTQLQEQASDSTTGTTTTEISHSTQMMYWLCGEILGLSTESQQNVSARQQKNQNQLFYQALVSVYGALENFSDSEKPRLIQWVLTAMTTQDFGGGRRFDPLELFFFHTLTVMNIKAGESVTESLSHLAGITSREKENPKLKASAEMLRLVLKLQALQLTSIKQRLVNRKIPENFDNISDEKITASHLEALDFLKEIIL